MLEIYPINDNNLLQERFAQSNIKFVDGAAGYLAYDRGEVVGCCLFVLNKQQTDIYHIAPAEDKLLCDSLIRSAINYSANRGVFKLFCKTPVTKAIATDLTYLLPESDEIDITSMMHGCKNCKKV